MLLCRVQLLASYGMEVAADPKAGYIDLHYNWGVDLEAGYKIFLSFSEIRIRWDGIVDRVQWDELLGLLERITCKYKDA